MELVWGAQTYFLELADQSRVGSLGVYPKRTDPICCDRWETDYERGAQSGLR